jgi:hypothetical protein
MVSMLDDLASLGSALAKTQQQKAWGSKAARANAARHIIRRLLSLRAEGLAMYLPMPLGQQFHACHAKWRLADGSNRSGKTMTTAVEAARAWCGCDPYNKYPPKSGNSLVVSLDNDHLSMLWRKCAEPGAFKIIPDEHTKLWRAVRPDPNNPTQIDPYDEAYREKWRDAPPLIPPRMIAGEPAWDEKKRGIPRVVKFTTGWKALFRSSEGKPPQGDHYNLVMFDEEMENTNFYYEAVRGLVSTGEAPQHAPKGIWSATAQVANYELAELRDKAEHGSEHVKLFKFLLDNNPYIPREEKQAFLESLSEDERRTRYYGIPALVGRKIYSTYEPMGLHGCDPFEIPPAWTRYVIIDPGRQHCGTLFVAIDPDQRHAWLYDGFDLRNGDATLWAAEVTRRQTEHRFEAFIIDQQMGKEHPPGAGLNVAQQYFAALTEAGIEPRVLGPLGGFFPGSNDVLAREEALLGWMQIRGSGPFSGSPRLQVMRGRAPAELDKQIRMAHYDLKKPDKRVHENEDLLVCLEYAAAYNPTYREPEPIPVDREPTPAELLKAKRRRQQQRGTNRSREVVPGLELG